MRRREFWSSLVLMACLPSTAFSANQKFAFKVKTKDGGIVGNVLTEATDVEAAKVKLMKRYPDCMILSVQVK